MKNITTLYFAIMILSISPSNQNIITLGTINRSFTEIHNILNLEQYPVDPNNKTLQMLTKLILKDPSKKVLLSGRPPIILFDATQNNLKKCFQGERGERINIEIETLMGNAYRRAKDSDVNDCRKKMLWDIAFAHTISNRAKLGAFLHMQLEIEEIDKNQNILPKNYGSNWLLSYKEINGNWIPNKGYEWTPSRDFRQQLATTIDYFYQREKPFTRFKDTFLKMCGKQSTITITVPKL